MKSGHLILTLERKIISNFLLLAVLLIAVGLVWEFYYTEINNKQFQESKNATTVIDYTNQMEVSLHQTLIYLNLIHEIRSTKDEIEDVRDIPLSARSEEGYSESISVFYSSSILLQEILKDKPVLLNEVYELKQRVLLYENLSKEWLEMADDFKEQSNVLFLSSIAPYFLNNIIPKFEEIRNLAIKQQEQVVNNLDAQLKRGRIFNYSATLITLLIGVFIALYLYRSIIQPLQSLTYSVKKLGEGNLNQRIEIETNDEFSYVAEAFNTMAQNLEEQTISSTYLDNVMESISEGIFVIDDSNIVRRLNDAGATMLELNKEELIGKSIFSFFNLLDPEGEKKEGRTQEYQLETVRNNKVPVLFSESDLIEEGNKKGKVLVVRDISELKRAEQEIKKSLEEKNVMLAEIHHRVKNNLAVISGLLQLQVLQTDSDEIHKALSDSQLRVQSIALIHEKLYSSDSLAYIEYDKYINDLVVTIKNTYESSEKEIDIISEIEGVSLNINQAIPCSLLINEVLVNAYKHAFTDQKKGKIIIKAKNIGGIINVEISDNGKGLKDKTEKESDSLGFTLIKTLTAQLDGETKFVDKEEGSGTLFNLTFKKEN
ncbi:MAG: histidine kinase dimerization/phosphoacceptor domain -containing protein [Balneola sp.]